MAMTLHDRMVSVLTEYDRKEEEKALRAKPGRGYHNKYALGHYMNALHEVDADLARGVPARKAVTEHFTGRLADKLLKVVGEGKTTREEQRGSLADYGFNPAVSAAQYGMAQAVLSGASTGMPVSVARELVDKTSPAMRRKFAKELASNPSKVGELTELLKGAHVMGDNASTGLAAYHAAAACINATRKRGVGAQFTAIRQALNSYRVVVSLADDDRIRIYRPDTGQEMFLGGTRKSNPESDAASMYESFHGTPSTGELVIQDQIHYHGNLAELGVLCGLKVRLVTGEDFTLEFGTPGREANPKGKGKRKRLKRGPLTTAYSTAQGIVPGLLGIGDGVIRGVTGNPRTEREKQLLAEIRETKREMKDLGYKVVSFMNRQPVEQGRYNERLFRLKTELEDERKRSIKQNRRGNPDGDSGPVILCSNETGNQLYFRGGDQSLDLDSLNLADAARDHMVIGEVWALAYATKKDFDEFAEIEYVHTLGLEKYHVKLPAKADLWEDAQPPKDDAFSCGNLPTLMYDSMNKSLSIAGGIYKIEKPWAETSPGIEN